MSPPTGKPAQRRTVRQSREQYARGIAGGLIFSLPLLFTEEMWRAGVTIPWERLIAYTVLTFALLLGYNRFSGMRRDADWKEVAVDSIEEMGLGIVLATVLLWLLDRITFGMAPPEVIGKVVVEAMTVAIGVSVGTAQLGGEKVDEADTGMAAGGAPGRTRADQFGAQLTITLCGAVLFAANVAPTDEITLLATESAPFKLLLLALLSLALGALVLHFSDFRGAQRLIHQGGMWGMVLSSGLTYTVALLASVTLLWFHGRLDGVSLYIGLAQTVVLGLASALGASAGRLLLQ